MEFEKFLESGIQNLQGLREIERAELWKNLETQTCDPPTPPLSDPGPKESGFTRSACSRKALTAPERSPLPALPALRPHVLTVPARPLHIAPTPTLVTRGDASAVPYVPF